ncbi:hypothetical protein CCHR01_19468 [Colletotrichum chrysophilum]|uniref:Uncharacterized protein n=1 Tax=Colletotrichum chrysophilum TaxID=1836956 RepID=A0AAD8ZZM8_9PEZI|nr:hypothetical protein CCHR01_19468 [Colletotrichum chrysophilum]
MWFQKSWDQDLANDKFQEACGHDEPQWLVITQKSDADLNVNVEEEADPAFLLLYVPRSSPMKTVESVMEDFVRPRSTNVHRWNLGKLDNSEVAYTVTLMYNLEELLDFRLFRTHLRRRSTKKIKLSLFVFGSGRTQSKGTSHLFRRLPPEIREQIYKEFWIACGLERHAFIEDGVTRYSPCVTNHEAPDERRLGLARGFAKSPERVLKYPRPRYVSDARTINISLRENSGNWLYLNGGSVWHTLAAKDTNASRVYVWLDAECPLTRRLLPEFRALWEGAPAEIAPKLTVDFPCDAEDGFCAWGEVDVREQNVCSGGGGWGAVERQGPIVPRFEVVGRGRQRFNETSCGPIAFSKAKPDPPNLHQHLYSLRALLCSKVG